MKKILSLLLIICLSASAAETNKVATIEQPKTGAIEGLGKWVDETDWGRTAKWLLSGAGMLLSGWYAYEYVDVHETSDPDPAPVIVSPGGSGSASDYMVTITGHFVGSPRDSSCGTFTPGLTFQPERQITALISSDTCAGQSVGASWALGREGEIVILTEDNFYRGTAALSGGTLILANGNRLAGGEINIRSEPQQ